MRFRYLLLIYLCLPSCFFQVDVIYDDEVDEKYGVMWSLTDMDDLGTRCYDAIGKNATIGIGLKNGYSDFDSIYPWSEIRRCNIKTVNGSVNIVFEGDEDFALDGSNGDVFVRIPRFCVDKFIKEGFEYRVISRSSGKVHPAFIEDGKELDEIYVGAFEGYIDNGFLMSQSDVIPTSNVVAESFLSSAKAKGEGFTLYDMRSLDAIWTLYAVEFGSRNTNQYLGFGFSDFLQPDNNERCRIIESASNTNSVKIHLMPEYIKYYLPEGTNITICNNNINSILTQAKITAIKDGEDYTQVFFDGPAISVTSSCFIGSAACTTNFCESCGAGKRLNWHTGYSLFIDGENQDKQNPMRYRWIENIIGSLWHFLPDISFDALQMYVCDNIKDYEFFKTTAPYRATGRVFPEQTDNGQKNDNFGVNHWVSSIFNDDLNTATVFGNSYSDLLTSRQAFGGYYYLSSNNVCVVNGGGFDHSIRCNMLTNRAWNCQGHRWFLVGARLMYKDISSEIITE